jgi:hypothetical protein
MTAGSCLERFNGRSFISQETCRRSGEGVRTPVWIATEAGVLYVRTWEQSGKIK